MQRKQKQLGERRVGRTSPRIGEAGGAGGGWDDALFRADVVTGND